MDSGTTSTMPVKKSGLLINRNFALLWVGQVTSIVGDIVFNTTLILWVATQIARGLPWAPLAVSGIFLALSLPTFFVGVVAGVFVDRWDRRRTMLQMDALRAVLVLLLLLIAGVIPLPFLAGGKLPVFWMLGTIYIIVLIMSTCTQFFNPSRFAVIGEIVDEPDRAKASGMSQMMFSIALVVGPPLAALLFFGVGVQWALLLNALSFVVSFITVSAIGIPQSARDTRLEQQKHFLREFGDGVRFYMGNRVLMTLLITGILFFLSTGALTTLDIFFLTQNLHASTHLYGFLGAAVGVGSVVGALVAGLVAQRIGIGRLFWLSAIAAGIMIIIYARVTSIFPALVLLSLFGLMSSAVNVAVLPLMLRATPQELIGRAISVRSPITSGALLLSTAVAGYLASTVLRGFHASLLGFAIGPIDTIFTVTGLLILAGGLYAVAVLRET
jgi:MFS family permease